MTHRKSVTVITDHPDGLKPTNDKHQGLFFHLTCSDFPLITSGGEDRGLCTPWEPPQVY